MFDATGKVATLRHFRPWHKPDPLLGGIFRGRRPRQFGTFLTRMYGDIRSARKASVSRRSAAHHPGRSTSFARSGSPKVGSTRTTRFPYEYLYKTLRLIKLQPTAHSLPRANT